MDCRKWRMRKQMLNIRKVIQAHLRAVHPRLHFLRAPESAKFPYLVYELEITNIGDDLQMVTLDVDGWDDNNDTTELEVIMDNVKKSLNKQIMIIDKLALFLDLDRRLTLTDTDPRINRRKYIFNGRLYER
jgi:hypothetical protein